MVLFSQLLQIVAEETWLIFYLLMKNILKELMIAMFGWSPFDPFFYFSIAEYWWINGYIFRNAFRNQFPLVSFSIVMRSLNIIERMTTINVKAIVLQIYIGGTRKIEMIQWCRSAVGMLTNKSSLFSSSFSALLGWANVCFLNFLAVSMLNRRLSCNSAVELTQL